jgi:hypothetical protein
LGGAARIAAWPIGDAPRAAAVAGRKAALAHLIL